MAVLPSTRFRNLSRVFSLDNYGTVVPNTNITPAFRNMIAAANAWGPSALLYIPAGTFKLTPLLSDNPLLAFQSLQYGGTLVGEGPQDTIIEVDETQINSTMNGEAYLLLLGSDASVEQMGIDGRRNSFNRTTIRNLAVNGFGTLPYAQNVAFRNLEPRQFYLHQGSVDASPAGVDYYNAIRDGSPIVFDGTAGGYVEDVLSHHNDGSGVIIRSSNDALRSRNITLDGLISNDNGWNGLSVTGAGDNIVLDNSYLHHNLREGLRSGWNEEVTVLDTIIEDNGLGTTLTYTSTTPANQIVVPTGPNIRQTGWGRRIELDGATLRRAGNGQEIVVEGGNKGNLTWTYPANGLTVPALYSEPDEVVISDLTFALNTAISGAKLLQYNEAASTARLDQSQLTVPSPSGTTKVTLDIPLPSTLPTLIGTSGNITRMPPGVTFPQQAVGANLAPALSAFASSVPAVTNEALNTTLVPGSTSGSARTITYTTGTGQQRISWSLPDTGYTSGSKTSQFFVRVRYRIDRVGQASQIRFANNALERGGIRPQTLPGGRDIGQWIESEFYSQFINGDTPTVRVVLEQPGDVIHLDYLQVYRLPVISLASVASTPTTVVTQPGVTTIHNTLNGTNPSKASALLVLDQVSMSGNQHVYQFGAVDPWTNLAQTEAQMTWTSLDRLFATTTGQFQVGNQVNQILTMALAPLALKQPREGYLSDDEWLEKAPVDSQRANFAELARRVVARYPNITHVVCWNEFKGLYRLGATEGVQGSGDGDHWDYVRYKALYDPMYAAVKSQRSTVKVGGPYTAVRNYSVINQYTRLDSDGQGTSAYNTYVGTTSPRDNGVGYGYVDRRTLEVVGHFIQNCTFDFIAVDGGIKSRDISFDPPSTTIPSSAGAPFRAMKLYYDVDLWIKARLAFYGKNPATPIIWNEWYGGDIYQTGGRIAEGVAVMSAGLVWHYLGGSTIPLLWKPEEFGLEYRHHNMWTSTAGAGGGAGPIDFGIAQKLFIDTFPTNTTVRLVTTVGDDYLIGLQSDTHYLMVNGHNYEKNIMLDGVLRTVPAFGVVAFVR